MCTEQATEADGAAPTLRFLATRSGLEICTILGEKLTISSRTRTKKTRNAVFAAALNSEGRDADEVAGRLESR